MDILKDAETVRQLGSILKTNVRACKAVGHPFVVQLGRIYLDMLNVYKCLSENISSAVQTNGQLFSDLESDSDKTKEAPVQVKITAVVVSCQVRW